MKKDHENPPPDLSPRIRRSKTREISSRFLSPTSSSETPISPTIRRTQSSTKHRSVEDLGLIRGLWPSSNTSSVDSSNGNNKLGTLADHLGSKRLKDFLTRKQQTDHHERQFLGRQRSCSEFSRFDKEKEKEKENSDENYRGGSISMRYTGRFRFPGKSSSKTSSLLAGRLSVDENSLNRRSSRRDSDSFLEAMSSESECSTDTATSSIGKGSFNSFRKTGIEVSSRYLNDPTTKLRRGTSDSNIPTPVSDGLPPKNVVKRASSLRAVSQWALSPGRSGSPPMSVENKGKPVMSFSNLKPPNSPSRSKGVGNLLLDLFKSKKSWTNCLPSPTPLGPGVADHAHHLRLLHNRLLQWRYVNAKSDAVNAKNMSQIENSLFNASNNVSKLQSTVVAKRIQFRKEKLEFKLNSILGSQFKSLESWGDLERQHLSATSTTKDCLHSVVCRVPLTEGAKVDSQKTTLALRQASDLTTSIKTMLIDFSPLRAGELLSELSDVASREKLLLQECFELLGAVSALEIQERNLRCSIIQLKSEQQQLLQGRRQQAVTNQ